LACDPQYYAIDQTPNDGICDCNGAMSYGNIVCLDAPPDHALCKMGTICTRIPKSATGKCNALQPKCKGAGGDNVYFYFCCTP